jgi:UDP-glucose:(heptosyl)LPS alpha-1,3-glucosyltransferase
VHDETLEVIPTLLASSVIPPGVDIPERQFTVMEKRAAREKLGLNPSVMTVGFVGHDFKKKGLGTLLKAAIQFPFDIQVMVIGKPAQADQYTELVKLFGPGKTCRFMGVISDMPNAYAAMDCLAHPTTQDVFPMVLLEAMAKHVPVITTTEPYNNMGSLLVDQGDAILLPTPDDVQGMVAGLIGVFLNADLRQKLTENGFLFAKKYSWEVAKSKYYEIYRSIQKKKMHPGAG